MGTKRTSGGSKGARRPGGRPKSGRARKASLKRATAKKKTTAKKKATARKRVTGKRAENKTTAGRTLHLSMGTAIPDPGPTLASRIAAIGDALTDLKIRASSAFAESAPSPTSSPPPVLHYAFFADRARKIGRGIADHIRKLDDAA